MSTGCPSHVTSCPNPCSIIQYHNYILQCVMYDTVRTPEHVTPDFLVFPLNICHCPPIYCTGKCSIYFIFF